uniref:Methyltransferase small domain-containing protein n=1 Tax=Erythrolobus madagascarensis TaxID=708628 RepID=A0A7S0XNI7_9RHOD|mmetsp:Transcript_4230/g.9223  ORF Transcript_4230/g.9223 Transcript_4230/m.9223 type:complete len:365 (+) Transcript_4230:160-1254(+)
MLAFLVLIGPESARRCGAVCMSRRPPLMCSDGDDAARTARRSRPGDEGARGLTYTRRKRDAWAAEDLERLPEVLRPAPDETLDLILRKKVLLLQARRGYRANTDSQMLALFAVECLQEPPDLLLDLGAANGLVSILLAGTFPACQAHLVELQASLADRANRNLQLNGISASRSRVIEADIAQPLELPKKYDLVVSNPPYYPRDTYRALPRGTEKRLAHIESSADLSQFALAMRKNLAENGVGCFIQDFSQQVRLIEAIQSSGLRITRVGHVFHTEVDLEPLRVLVAVSLPNKDQDESFNTVGCTDTTSPSLLPSPCRIVLHPGDNPASTTYTEDHEDWLRRLPRPPFVIGRLRPEYDHDEGENA